MYEQYFPYKEYRENQKEAIEKIINSFISGKKYILLSAPTGAGKSAIALTIANWIADQEELSVSEEKYSREGGRTFIATPEKILQKQYKEDFYDESKSLDLLMGKLNYDCKYEGFTAVDAPCRVDKKLKNKCKALGCCEYISAREASRSSNILLLNFHYLLAEFEFVPSFVRIPSADLLISDEAHNIEMILLDHGVIQYDDKIKDTIESCRRDATKLSKYLVNLGFKNKVTKFQNVNSEIYKAFSKLKHVTNENAELDGLKDSFRIVLETLDAFTEQAGYVADLYVDSIQDKLEKLTWSELKKKDPFFSIARGIQSKVADLHNLETKISGMLENFVSDEWVADCNAAKGIYALKPLYAANIWHSIFEDISQKFLFMSATLPSKELFSKNFNIPIDQIEYIDLPSVFPAERRPVYVLPIVNLSYTQKHRSKPVMLEFVKTFMKEHSDKKILIHSGNYEFANYLKDNIHSNRIITHDSRNRMDILAHYKASTDPLVLISPSLIQGVNLEGDSFTLQLILKVPYASLADKRIKKRMNLNSLWYVEDALIKIIQATGRCMRSKDDHCETYIIDQNFSKYLNKPAYNELIPSWYKDSIIDVG